MTSHARLRGTSYVMAWCFAFVQLCLCVGSVCEYACWVSAGRTRVVQGVRVNGCHLGTGFEWRVGGGDNLFVRVVVY